jgi:putative tricarboxylic transport membrane protein
LNRNETSGAIAIFLFGMLTIFFSLRMPIGTFRAAGSGMFPLCLGILLVVLSGIHLIRVHSQDEQPVEKKPQHGIPGSAKQVIFFIGAMALATLLFNPLGFPLMSFLLMLALLRILGMRRWSHAVSISIFSAAASYFLFVQWLQIPLPKGWIGL